MTIVANETISADFARCNGSYRRRDLAVNAFDAVLQHYNLCICRIDLKRWGDILFKCLYADVAVFIVRNESGGRVGLALIGVDRDRDAGWDCRGELSFDE